MRHISKSSQWGPLKVELHRLAWWATLSPKSQLLLRLPESRLQGQLRMQSVVRAIQLSRIPTLNIACVVALHSQLRPQLRSNRRISRSLQIVQWQRRRRDRNKFPWCSSSSSSSNNRELHLPHIDRRISISRQCNTSRLPSKDNRRSIRYLANRFKGCSRPLPCNSSRCT